MTTRHGISALGLLVLLGTATGTFAQNLDHLILLDNGTVINTEVRGMTDLATPRVHPAACETEFATFDHNFGPDFGTGWAVSDGYIGCFGPATKFTINQRMGGCELSVYAAHTLGTNQYEFAIHLDADGVPGETVFRTTRTDLGEWEQGMEPVVFDISHLCLDPGDYWLSMTASAGFGNTWGVLPYTRMPEVDTEHANDDCGTWEFAGIANPGCWSVTSNPECGSGLALTFDGNCPGDMTFTVTNATPNRAVAFAYSTQAGDWTVPGGRCAGTQLGIVNPTVAGLVSADESGEASLTGFVPRTACGQVYVQAVDVATCTASNIQAL